MKFSINQSELQNALAIVSKGISTRSTLPILSGIHIKALGDSVTFQTTNLELSIQYTSQALVEEEGEIVAPGKLFLDIIKNLPDASVQIEANTYETVSIQCAGASFTVKTLNPDDFPAFPKVSVFQTIELPFGLVTSMIKKVVRVVSKDESHMILTGVLLEAEEDQVRFVATDSYRLAVAEQTLQEPLVEPFSAVISGSFLNDIVSLPKSESLLKISLSENQILMMYQNIVFVNRRIEGDFPNYKRLLPSSCTSSVLFKRDELSAAVKRASLMGTTVTPVRLSIHEDKNELVVSSSAQDIGSVQESLSCDISGDSFDIAFNSAYVLDGLSSAGEDQLVLEVESPFKPGIFKTVDSSKYLYLVMPVRIS